MPQPHDLAPLSLADRHNRPGHARRSGSENGDIYLQLRLAGRIAQRALAHLANRLAEGLPSASPGEIPAELLEVASDDPG
jgi:hypothetical protein